MSTGPCLRSKEFEMHSSCRRRPMTLGFYIGTLVLLPLAFGQRPPSKQEAKPYPPSRESSQPRSWTGKLMDAEKKNCNPVLLGSGESCPVSVTTTSFGLVLPEGKYV